MTEFKNINKQSENKTAELITAAICVIFLFSITAYLLGKQIYYAGY